MLRVNVIKLHTDSIAKRERKKDLKKDKWERKRSYVKRSTTRKD
jgi:hypothetical protein